MASRWVITRAGRELGRRVRGGWPGRGGYAGWGLLGLQVVGTLGVFGVVLGVVAGVTWGARAWEPAGLGAWDVRTLEAVALGRGWASGLGFGFVDGIMFESPTNLLILGPVTGVCTAVALWWGRVWLAVQFALCYGLARFLPGFGWSLWDRARPDFVAEGVAAPAAHAFPSGHALFALTTYGLLAYLWASRSGSWVERVLAFGVLGVLAAVVGYGRLLLGAHWPSDLIGAWVIGAVWLAGNVLVLRWVEVKGRKLIVGSDK